ncbi:AMIN-like domain-containing (lipo)protein [Frankia torreyi]|uniref:AMIN-like domain-containing (lipo)protein n=1 Tax=Frankia torreyi TaxID=1856 RepID=UPI003BB6306C
MGIAAIGHRQNGRPAGYDRIAFTFRGASFPTYEFRWVARSELTQADGRVVPIAGDDVLRILFLRASIDLTAPRRASVAGLADVVEYAVADTETPNFSVGVGVHREISGDLRVESADRRAGDGDPRDGPRPGAVGRRLRRGPELRSRSRPEVRAAGGDPASRCSMVELGASMVDGVGDGAEHQERGGAAAQPRVGRVDRGDHHNGRDRGHP